MTYQPKVYREQGGDKLVVASGGEIEVQSGGTLDLQAGSTVGLDDITVSDTLTVAATGEIDVLAGGRMLAAGTQASHQAALAITYSSNDPSITPNGAVTIADGSAPTVSELLECVEELSAMIQHLNTVVEGIGAMATS